MPKEITSSELRECVDRPDGVAVVLFHGSWCGDCRVFRPTWDRWCTGKKGPVFIMEILKGGREWMNWAIDEIPTVAVYSDGSELGRAHGEISESDLDRLWKLIQ